MSIRERLNRVESRLDEACRRSGRSRTDVGIVAVTKYVSTQTAMRAVDLGLRHIGENRWQDAKPKWEAIGDRAEWHFIGHLQTNKVKDVVGKFAYIHSVDRLPLAVALEKRAEALGIAVNCLLQLNVSGEESKYGLAPEQLLPFAEQLSKLSRVRVTGLMTMAPYEADAESTRPVFRGLRQLRDMLNDKGSLGYEVRELSMGMSNDFEVAVEEGATWVRLGSVLVGNDEDNDRRGGEIG